MAGGVIGDAAEIREVEPQALVTSDLLVGIRHDTCVALELDTDSLTATTPPPTIAAIAVRKAALNVTRDDVDGVLGSLLIAKHPDDTIPGGQRALRATRW